MAEKINVLLNNQGSTSSQGSRVPWKKIVLGVVVIVLAVELIWAGMTLLKAPSPPSSPPPQKEVGGARINLSSDQKVVKVGDELKVKILVDTAGKSSDGVDVVLRFDPKLLVPLATTSAFLTQGTAYQEFPQVSVDSLLGIVRLSATIPPGIPGFSGKGLLGTLSFRAKGAGVTTLALDYTKGMSDDSNIAAEGTSLDILEGVDNLKIKIE